MAQPLIRMPTPKPPAIAPPMLLETRLYTDRLDRNDPEATTDEISRDELAQIVEEMKSPNRMARDLIAYTWPTANIRRTELILDRRGFRKKWRRLRDQAVETGDVATATLALSLIDAVDRMVPECLVVCLCDVGEGTWELFVDIEDERILGCRSRKDIW